MVYSVNKSISIDEIEQLFSDNNLSVVKFDNTLTVETNNRFDELGKEISSVYGKLISYHRCEISIFFENEKTNLYTEYYTKNYVKLLIILVWFFFTYELFSGIVNGDIISIIIFIFISIISILNLTYRIRSFRKRIENILFLSDFVRNS